MKKLGILVLMVVVIAGTVYATPTVENKQKVCRMMENTGDQPE